MKYLILRFKLAWHAFFLKKYHAYFANYHISATLLNGTNCDECKLKEASVCVNGTLVEVVLSREPDHYHYCKSCADNLLKKSDGKLTVVEERI